MQVRRCQDRSRPTKVLGVADAHILSLDLILKGPILPCEFYGIVPAGQAALFIGARDGEVGQLIDESNCGFTIAYGDAKALTFRITQLASDLELGRAMGGQVPEAFDNRWNKKRAMGNGQRFQKR